MKFPSPSKTLNSERPTSNAQSIHRTLPLLFLLLLIFYSASELHAQVGNNNPTGPSGIFNGNITTGCSYDPYTGNVNRSVTDMVVAGALGKYPLALTRTSNSRNAWGNAFGLPGAWRHNYQWSIQAQSRGLSPQDIHYTVDFPDGRAETLNYSASDPYYRAALGVRERLQPWSATNGTTGVCYLILPDGGKVEFTGTRIWMHDPELLPPDWYEFDLVATASIDPYGQRTTFTYDGYRRIYRVTEPTGRYLQFYYRTTSGPTIDHVTASDGRSVQYYYTNISPGGTTYSALSSVVYYGNTNWTARYTYQAPNLTPTNGVPLLRTADDPFYPGPMKRIAYDYKTGTNPDGTAAVYGQILSERYYDGTNPGAPVSTLEITTATTRKETRGDNKWRTFTYSSTGYLTSNTDFSHVSASQTYDVNKYINSVTDRNQNQTDFTSNPLNGILTQTTFPLTPNDTQPPQQVRSTVQYTYGWANCPDPNNRDANNPYYLYKITDEGGRATIFTRDPNKRITRIDYPDNGYETFTYNGFGQVLAHRMATGGTESFTYDARGLKQTYRNPSNATGNPTARYLYDTLDRVKDVTDALGGSFGDPVHSTSFTYNLRGQVLVTTLPKDPVDNARHTITNIYNPDGTLQTRTNQLSQTTSYTYDDYRRLKSVTPPIRGAGDNIPHPTYFFYDPSGTGDDYKYADSNVTYVTLPSGKRIKATYDDNRRKDSVTAAVGTVDFATTFYGYDDAGNLLTVLDPRGHLTTTAYDQRNRPSEIRDALNIPTTFKYDLAGRKKSVTRPNNQVITYDTYDAMNRVLQQTATQTPDPAAVTQYTYYTPADGANAPVGLLKTMKDPRLVATNSTENYSYEYDTTGRKKKVTYPRDSFNVRRTEQFTYDTAGRLWTFINRNGRTQTFAYDALHRMIEFSWNDGGVTPSVTFGYDIGSRLITINNADAAISRQYFNDGLLRVETEQIINGPLSQLVYTYDGNGNRASAIIWPSNASFNYLYSGRNQLKDIVDNVTGATLASYGYDANGNVISRSLNNGTNGSTYDYDDLDRVTSIVHPLSGTTRWFSYDYDSVGNRKWTTREGNVGDVFSYDLADQVSGVQLNVPNPSGVQSIPRTIICDANGNRTSFSSYGPTHTYTINNLNQYTARTNSTSPLYDYAGNMTRGMDNSSYTYDAQNRLRTANNATFKYDGLNRQVSRTVGGATTYSAWDGWDLVQEYQGNQGSTITARYVHGATGLVKNQLTNNYYYQDGSGSTSHLTSSAGALLEWYRYDLQGTPIINDQPTNHTSAFGVRHLFTGQQWYGELGLYDLRNRFYSPDIGRFLQPDPIGFWGDGSNLYRYCSNNPLKLRDPSGLETITQQSLDGSAPEAYYGSELLADGSDYSNREFPYNPSTGEGSMAGVGIGGPYEGRDFADNASDNIGSGRGVGDGPGGGGGHGGSSFGSQLARGAHALIPGAIAYDNMRANWAAGNTGLAVANGITWVGEQALFVFTLGQSVAAQTASRAFTVANPVPSTLARVIPGRGPFPTLGPPGAADVFVTDATAIEGLTAVQISQRLGIDPSDTFTVIRFTTPSEGLATPVFRSNPGFVGGGLTKGGAPEFVVPNGPIPAGATATVIGPP